MSHESSDSDQVERSDLQTDSESHDNRSIDTENSDDIKDGEENESKTQIENHAAPAVLESKGKDVTINVQILKENKVDYWFRVEMNSEDSPQDLSSKVKVELEKNNSRYKPTNINDYELFNYGTSRFVKMYLQSIAGNSINSAKNQVLFINKNITLNIILPNLTVLKREFDGSDKFLKITETLCSQLGITSSEEFSMFEADPKTCSYDQLAHVDSLTPEDLKKFSLPSPDKIKAGGLRLDHDISNNMVRYQNLKTKKFFLNLSPIEQNLRNNDYVYLRFDSISTVQVFTSSETIRRNLLCCQIYSDSLLNIYEPASLARIYKLAGIFCAISIASYQKDQLDPRSHTFKDELKEAIQYLVENGGQSSTKFDDIEFLGDLIEFKQKNHPLYGTLKKEKRCKLSLTDSGKNVVVQNFYQNSLLLRQSNSEITVKLVEHTLSSKEAKAAQRKKEVAIKIEGSTHSYTVRPDFDPEYKAIIKFLAAQKLVHVAHSSEIQHVDFQNAESSIKESIAMLSDQYAHHLNQSSINKSTAQQLKDSDISIEKYLNVANLKGGNSNKDHQAQIGKYCREVLQGSSLLEKIIIKLISEVTLNQDYINPTLMSSFHYMSFLNTTNRNIIQEHYNAQKDGIKPNLLRFSIMFYTDRLLIKFIKPNVEKYGKVLDEASVQYKHCKGWKFDTMTVTALIEDSEEVETLKMMMEQLNILPENKRYSIIVESDNLAYSDHQVFAQTILLCSRKSNKRDYYSKLENYLNRGAMGEHSRDYKNENITGEGFSENSFSRRGIK